MTYQELEAKLVDYIYDELAESEREAFEAGLKEHPDLAEEAKAHVHTRSLVGALEPVTPPQAVLNEVMRQVNAEVAQKRQSSWVDKLAAFMLQPAVATAFIFLMIASASLMLADDPLEASSSEGEQPYAVGTELSEEGVEQFAPQATRTVAKSSNTQLQPRKKRSLAAAAPTTELEPKNPEVQVAKAPKSAGKARKKSASSKREQIDQGLRKVGIQLAQVRIC